MIRRQQDARITNHPYSERSKYRPRVLEPSESIGVGDIVYLFQDKKKTSPRPRYIVASIDGQWCFIRKFTGSQLRDTAYKVRIEECYKVPEYKYPITQSPPIEINDYSTSPEEPPELPHADLHCERFPDAPSGLRNVPEQITSRAPVEPPGTPTIPPEIEMVTPQTSAVDSTPDYPRPESEMHHSPPASSAPHGPLDYNSDRGEEVSSEPESSYRSRRPQRNKKRPKYLDDCVQ